MSGQNKFTLNLTGKPFNIRVPEEENALTYLSEGEQILKKHFQDYASHATFKTLPPEHQLTLVAFSVAYDFAREKHLGGSAEAREKLLDLVDLISHVVQMDN